MTAILDDGVSRRSAVAQYWSRSGRAALVTLPSLLFFVVFFVGPFAALVYFSFLPNSPEKVLTGPITVDNYRRFISDGWYWSIAIRSLKLSLIVTGATLTLGFAIAYWLDRGVRRFQGVLIGMLLMPIMVSLVVQSYGWLVLLSPKGMINSLLIQAGLVDRPIKLIFNEVGVAIGLTQYILPFAVLPILTSLQGIDRSTERAAQTLGASPLQVFCWVTLPLSLKGVAAGAMLAFLLALTAIVTPLLMGGQTVITLPVLAYQQFGQSFNWPFGSAVVTLLTVSVLLIVAAANFASRDRHSRMA